MIRTGESDSETGGGEPIRLLIAEDEPADVELLIRELARAGYAPEWRRVDTESSFLTELAAPTDVIISDNSMPSFSAARALELLKERAMRVPFIVVSRAIGEEQAVALIRDGADDYVMKDRLARIGPAVRHVLDQARLRKEHAASQEALHRLNEELEHRIAQRTNELQIANEALERELRDRARVEDELRHLTNELESHVAVRTTDLLRSQGRLRALASELVLTEQRERRRLATDLHDYLAQLLVLARLKLGQAQPKITEGAASTLLLQAEDALKQALTYTRTLVADLSPPVLREFGLVAALKWLGEHMNQRQLRVSVDAGQDHVRVPEEQAVLVFQSVRELLINVAKHAGTKHASVHLTREEDGIRIEVRDHGSGIAAADLPHVFERFYRGDRARLAGGSGLGLAIAREIVIEHGGELALESRPGQGTTATFILPRAAERPG